ncbi:MAG TPA: hypothetical protein VK963_00650, partial [Candidatus Saccharimonadales bacterium]|nr:hypothetical protein [Candidatus Saccharimonadales bacterium]
GSLDTCRNASGVGPIITNPGQADACSAVLTANGFLMAQQFKFRRTGPAGAPGLQLSESINLLPGLYLATPPAFSDFITAKPRPDGERGPLY